MGQVIFRRLFSTSEGLEKIVNDDDHHKPSATHLDDLLVTESISRAVSDRDKGFGSTSNVAKADDPSTQIT